MGSDKKSGGSAASPITSRIVSINISEKKGTSKHSVEQVILTEGCGIKDDAHSGSGIRELSLLASESIKKMEGMVEGLGPGLFGENLTTAGITLHKLLPGTRLKAGDAVIEITQIGKECHFGCEIRNSAGKCIMPEEGVFAKVIQSGSVTKGDSLTIISRMQ